MVLFNAEVTSDVFPDLELCCECLKPNRKKCNAAEVIYIISEHILVIFI